MLHANTHHIAHEHDSCFDNQLIPFEFFPTHVYRFSKACKSIHTYYPCKTVQIHANPLIRPLPPSATPSNASFSISPCPWKSCRPNLHGAQPQCCTTYDLYRHLQLLRTLPFRFRHVIGKIAVVVMSLVVAAVAAGFAAAAFVVAPPRPKGEEAAWRSEFHSQRLGRNWQWGYKGALNTTDG